MDEQQLSERQHSILNLIKAQGFIGIDALAQNFGLTTQTIRRDVNRLSSLGLLRRVHGGVEPAVTPHNIAYSARRILQRRAKSRIAQRVAAAIPNGSSLAFSIGTTPTMVASALEQHEGLRVYTNNLNVATEALKNPTTAVTIAGGQLRHGDMDILGLKAEDFFDRYKVDIGIFGVAGVDGDGTLLDFHEEEVAARQAILRNCRKSFLVVDSSKFGRQAHVRGGFLQDVSVIATEVMPDRPYRQLLEASAAQVLLCP
ncbi:DeoR/GlpR family DNA-binding transcription regulator [Polycladidibacter hongkongensis]|uniref:DeoR/GlpR family DNA-binding transcription regulator n=1 Tax=Polycladidibacter hongkongensis TaxID=1647556 RepID=UPI0008330E36|nr:DeoR/GlpR family DNA-binding transcription regulator [Pseudovibrio hongkongensis]